MGRLALHAGDGARAGRGQSEREGERGVRAPVGSQLKLRHDVLERDEVTDVERDGVGKLLRRRVCSARARCAAWGQDHVTAERRCAEVRCTLILQLLGSAPRRSRRSAVMAAPCRQVPRTEVDQVDGAADGLAVRVQVVAVGGLRTTERAPAAAGFSRTVPLSGTHEAPAVEQGQSSPCRCPLAQSPAGRTCPSTRAAAAARRRSGSKREAKQRGAAAIIESVG